MTNPLERIHEYLTMVAKLRDNQGPERFYLDHGVACGERVYGIAPQMERKQCFYNCFMALSTYEVDPSEWSYCEGYAIRRDLGIPINHAWLVNEQDGTVFDPTWDEGEATYFGVPFQFEYLKRSAVDTGYPSPCWVSEMFNVALADKDPGTYRQDIAVIDPGVIDKAS